jgi:C-terminal processing protease CtpA/Prc
MDLPLFLQLNYHRHLAGGGQSTPPARLGCYTLDGKDIEFNGLQPDSKVLNNFDDKMNGRDPQLNKAIEVILGKLKK